MGGMDANHNVADDAAETPASPDRLEDRSRVTISNPTGRLWTTCLVTFGLAIPPAWMEVVICRDRAGEIDGGPMDITPMIEMVCLFLSGGLIIVSIFNEFLAILVWSERRRMTERKT